MISKLEYLVKTLSRTKRKDYENYVINRVWSVLDDPEIKPVSQQYVKRSDTKYALIDLYFPQLNIGVECDEFHHKISDADKKYNLENNCKTQDELRTEDILSAIEEYEQIRIPIYSDSEKRELLSLDEINKRIHNAVEKIKQRKKIKQLEDNFTPWTEDDDIKLAKAKGFISVNDNFHFRVNGDVRELFGLKNVNVQRCFYKLPNAEDHLWMPHLAIQMEDKLLAGSTVKYLNLYSMTDDKEGVIYEHLVPSRKGETEAMMSKSMRTKENFNRIVFAKSRDNLGMSSFRFLGVYNKTGRSKMIDINGKKTEFAVHERVSDQVKLTAE